LLATALVSTGVYSQSAKDVQAAFRRRRPGPVAGADGAGVPGGPPSV